MTRFQAGMRYEMTKLLKALCLFIVGIAVLLGVVRLIASVGGLRFVSIGNIYSFVLLFLAFWLPVTFKKDAGFFLQSGLTRWQAFAIFALATVVESLAFAIADGALSLATPRFWLGQSPVLGVSDAYTGALFVHVLLLNLAVALCALAVAALQRRVGTWWTVVLAIGLIALALGGLPAVCSLFPGGTEALGSLVLSVAASPDAPEGSEALPVIFFAAAAVAAASITWALMRRAEAR